MAEIAKGTTLEDYQGDTDTLRVRFRGWDALENEINSTIDTFFLEDVDNELVGGEDFHHYCSREYLIEHLKERIGYWHKVYFQPSRDKGQTFSVEQLQGAYKQLHMTFSYNPSVKHIHRIFAELDENHQGPNELMWFLMVGMPLEMMYGTINMIPALKENPLDYVPLLEALGKKLMEVVLVEQALAQNPLMN